MTKLKAENTGSMATGVLALGMLAGLAGCKSNAPAAPVAQNGIDPANANLAVAGGSVDPNQGVALAQTGSYQQGSTSGSTYRAPARVLGQRSEAQGSYVNGEDYPAGDVPQGGYAYNNPDYDQQVENGQDALDSAEYQPVYAEQAPPPLPVYEQPELTDPNTIWTPGYWNYATAGYYWVPGAWVAPPYVGALWTPGYWGYGGNRYRFHRGFWGRHIGFYGGIPYGYGYTGYGYQGGYWQGNNFFYNQQVNRINVNVVRNVYTRQVNVVNTNVTRISFNGPGGYNVQPRPAEIAAYREQRLPPMQTQIVNVRLAESNRQQFFQDNHGRPELAASRQVLQADRTQAAPLRTTPAFARFAQQEQRQQNNAGTPQQRGLQQSQARGFTPGQADQRTQAGQQRFEPGNRGAAQLQQQQANAQQRFGAQNRQPGTQAGQATGQAPGQNGQRPGRPEGFERNQQGLQETRQPRSQEQVQNQQVQNQQLRNQQQRNEHQPIQARPDAPVHQQTSPQPQAARGPQVQHGAPQAAPASQNARPQGTDRQNPQRQMSQPHAQGAAPQNQPRPQMQQMQRSEPQQRQAAPVQSQPREQMQRPEPQPHPAAGPQAQGPGGEGHGGPPHR